MKQSPNKQDAPAGCCIVAALCVSWMGALAPSPAAAQARLSFNRDIRPILSENCFHCHGPDAGARQAGLALHTAGQAAAAIRPGRPDESELVARVFSNEHPMPPVGSNRSLSEAQKGLLRQWIAEGAEYQSHWAYLPPQRPPTPTPEELDGRPTRTPIDAFIQARLAQEGLAISPEAEPEVLARRATLALTGLAPTPAETDQFLADEEPGAYERLVDRLLASDAYAERMTLVWLDASRFADSDGYQNDAPRSNWPWRDWVIAAYRDNMPFDRFTIEQLAGDMLPNPTPSQRLATAFNRNHRQNGEGGALEEEFFVENVIDRVETTSAVWLGLTTGCARCHDHKYDPISQREFYQLYAYFDNIGERGIGKGVDADPLMQSGSPLRPIPAPLADRLAAAERGLESARKGLPDRRAAWVRRMAADGPSDKNEWFPVEPAKRVTVVRGERREEAAPMPDGSYEFGRYGSQAVAYEIDVNTAGEAITGLRIDVLPSSHLGQNPTLGAGDNGNFVVTNLSARVAYQGEPAGTKLEIARVQADYEQPGYPASKAIDSDAKSGWAVNGADPSRPVRLQLQLKEPIKKDVQATLTLVIEQNSIYANHTIGRLRAYFSTLPMSMTLTKSLNQTLRKPQATWTDAQRKEVDDHYAKIDPPLLAAIGEHDGASRAIDRAGFARVPVMVMNERDDRRPTYLLSRGQYDAPDLSEALPRTVIAALLGDHEAPRDRLELAEWIVSRDNPITARVVANRMWQHMFGIGLVKTTEDFGSQGERPSHPELLDWLAVEFIDSGWDVKQFYRLIARSSVFRQSSRVTPALHEKDPENRLLARGPRYRIDGFAVRDVALGAAGLLRTDVGGPPVKPYQPGGLWEAVGASASDRYVQDTGDNLYRKSMYTYWRRAVNPPLQTIFDASGREVCNVRRRLTNTPLQALALMNDETFIEAARRLAQRMMTESGRSPDERLAYGYRLATAYHASPATLQVLRDNLGFFKGHFAERQTDALALLAHGQSPRDQSLDASEHAAYTAVAHLILNLDETITLE
ncbi:Planctomycete cytochrome C [Pirellulimonas nuda]|uniref:Planctomycete cytochrome C n=1 Tax=Pirellulimonas nuda TaxID=2528009 RepID=A0A518DE70_9BACT|nr:PSD1 and planctomycete cytochrome C domain-containing protein [Pirellulimonas nuda]QDU89753.1 Planctomycete cytochrome C [Pirellulimonas nuda]